MVGHESIEAALNIDWIDTYSNCPILLVSILKPGMVGHESIEAALNID